MVDVFLRISSNVQRQIEDLCVSIYIQVLQYNHKGAGIFIKHWNSLHGQQPDPSGCADLRVLSIEKRETSAIGLFTSLHFLTKSE